jgi:hypothetical protein
MGEYFNNIWIALSQLLNVVFCFGNPNESLSSRAYRQPWNIVMWIFNHIIFWQNNHCRGAFAHDLRMFEDYIQSAKDKGIYR